MKYKLFIQIDKDSTNKPTFTDFEYRQDSSVYFYPASTVKVPIAFLGLEKIE